ncbi:DNA-3-methyladenine glycosylase I [Acinetobacter chinensis]|jgi:DNA-3-methyladenine glycosylase I|uniref:DNA-3-methyladenine glycosylase I n=1 Tax=Acinetobacter chinensis TaxID=2004650 RepID=A0A3B7M6D3_9GAMM|nr:MULTISPECIES: DNA-3-methyladenine glycosylase I [Acinetobacter]AXY58233.1 DNA-3-methyladenine glycosylase I [Acinetobacter chinensis]AXY58693.1 DNA-3-methyladenine glycosylase I [Acinetobacter sp. WCHAc010052]
MSFKRCGWCSDDPLYIAYHDQEWGKAVHHEQHLFEMLCLEGQQAGLSWITVLKKRECYRQHFFQYPIAQIAQFSDAELQLKVQDAGLIRHIGKLTAIRDNAVAWQNMQAQGHDMVTWLWDFVGQQIQINHVPDYRQAPAQTEVSQRLSKALKKQGFKFVGPTTMYAFMQAVGMVDDHENDCDFKKNQ